MKKGVKKKSKKKFFAILVIIILIILVAIIIGVLNYKKITGNATGTCSIRNEQCGGIAGTQCCAGSGLICLHDYAGKTHSDIAGKCALPGTDCASKPGDSCSTTRWCCDIDSTGKITLQCENNKCTNCVLGSQRDCYVGKCQGYQTCSGSSSSDAKWGNCIADTTKCCLTEGEIRDCTTSDKCAGKQTCTSGLWSSCAKTNSKCADGNLTDGRLNNKYLSIDLIMNYDDSAISDGETVECGNASAVTFDSRLYTFVDEPNQPQNNSYLAVLRSSLIYQKTNKETYGLPANFNPVVGYYFPFSGGRVHLWNNNNELYIYAPSIQKYTKVLDITKMNLNSRPDIGYYYKINGKEGLELWTTWDKIYELNLTTYKFDGPFSVTGKDNSFTLSVGYYYKFDSGTLTEGINLWDTQGNLYTYDPTNKKLTLINNIKGGLGLPTNFKPTLGYYSSTYGGRIYLWGYVGDSGYYSTKINKLYIYVPATGKYLDKTADFQNASGIAGLWPSLGYSYNFPTNTSLGSGIDLWSEGGILYQTKDILNQVKFEFSDLYMDIVPAASCFTAYNGDMIFDETKCDLRPRETVELPCYSNAGLITVYDKIGTEICRKNVAGKC